MFHHPAIRDPNVEIQQTMFNVVRKWVDRQPDRGAKINQWLSADGVRNGQNHTNGVFGGGMEGGHGKIQGSDLAAASSGKKSSSRTKVPGQEYTDRISAFAGSIGGPGLQHTVEGLLSTGTNFVSGIGHSAGGSSDQYYR